MTIEQRLQEKLQRELNFPPVEDPGTNIFAEEDFAGNTKVTDNYIEICHAAGLNIYFIDGQSIDTEEYKETMQKLSEYYNIEP